jgi:hypothetical protein
MEDHQGAVRETRKRVMFEAGGDLTTRRRPNKINYLQSF